MAEVGLIASVIQVAGAGLKLSQTLYQYADSVASADRRVKDIAKEVQLTSFVIEELGSLFKQDDTSALLSENARKTADETVRECSSVFKELDAALKKTKKNTLGRLMLPFRESKIELLRSHIDKLKSTLQLLMQVLTHAHQVASQRLDREAEAAQREQIKALLQNKKESTKRYEESLKNFRMSEDSTVVDEDEPDKEKQNLFSEGIMAISTASVSSTITVKTLETCVHHIESLLEDIEDLQQALSNQEKGGDHSEHHQSLIGSYFRARGHLDNVLLGNAKSLRESTSSSVIIESEAEERREKILMKEKDAKRAMTKSTRERRRQRVDRKRAALADEELETSFSKTLTGSTLRDAETRTSQESVVQTVVQGKASRFSGKTYTEEDFKRAVQMAKEEARREERERLAAETGIATDKRALDEHGKARRAAGAARKEAVLKAMAMKAAEEEARTKAEKEDGEARMKAMKEVEEARLKAEEADKKAKAEFERRVQEEIAKRIAQEAKPTVALTQPPIKFKDAVGRRFSFPFHLCKAWQGMEGLIKQAFLNVDIIGDYVMEGRYDLLNSEGIIILPSYWETVIQPGYEITMHMHPMPKREDDSPPPSSPPPPPPPPPMEYDCLPDSMMEEPSWEQPEYTDNADSVDREPTLAVDDGKYGLPSKPAAPVSFIYGKDDVGIWETARATSAAPDFFFPTKIGSEPSTADGSEYPPRMNPAESVSFIADMAGRIWKVDDVDLFPEAFETGHRERMPGGVHGDAAMAGDAGADSVQVDRGALGGLPDRRDRYKMIGKERRKKMRDNASPSAPPRISFHGEMEDRTVQSSPDDSRPVDIVIGGSRRHEVEYQTQKDRMEGERHSRRSEELKEKRERLAELKRLRVERRRLELEQKREVGEREQQQRTKEAEEERKKVVAMLTLKGEKEEQESRKTLQQGIEEDPQEKATALREMMEGVVLGPAKERRRAERQYLAHSATETPATAEEGTERNPSHNVPPYDPFSQDRPIGEASIVSSANIREEVPVATRIERLVRMGFSLIQLEKHDEAEMLFREAERLRDESNDAVEFPMHHRGTGEYIYHWGQGAGAEASHTGAKEDRTYYLAAPSRSGPRPEKIVQPQAPPQRKAQSLSDHTGKLESDAYERTTTRGAMPRTPTPLIFRRNPRSTPSLFYPSSSPSELKPSREYTPLYLLERKPNRNSIKTIEEVLPTLPPGRSSSPSQASSNNAKEDEHQSAVDDDDDDADREVDELLREWTTVLG